jgi:dTMP kinase
LLAAKVNNVTSRRRSDRRKKINPKNSRQFRRHHHLTGTFLTFEGIDGSGKTTQLRLLTEVLKTRGFDVVTTREPGGTMLGRSVRELLLDGDLQPAPLAELLLFAADRAQHVETLVRPALAAGKIVVSDRYSDATAAYQGAGRGFSSDIIRQTINLATGGLQPDLTLFFDLPVADALARMGERTEAQNRLDKETIDFHERVREEYLKIAGRESARFRIVKAGGAIDEIHREAVKIVLDFLEARLKAV